MNSKSVKAGEGTSNYRRIRARVCVTCVIENAFTFLHISGRGGAAASRALAHCQPEAMRAYARQAKNKKLEVDASEIRFRAERRIGELMAAQSKVVGLNRGLAGSAVTGSKRDPVRDNRPTLADAGIDKHLADRARKYAAIPMDEFEGILADRRGRIGGLFRGSRIHSARRGTAAQGDLINANAPSAALAGGGATARRCLAAAGRSKPPATSVSSLSSVLRWKKSSIFQNLAESPMRPIVLIHQIRSRKNPTFNSWR